MLGAARIPGQPVGIEPTYTFSTFTVTGTGLEIVRSQHQR